MKGIEEFLSELSNLDVKLSVEDNNLRCNAPKGKLTAALRTELAERKAEIIDFLRQANAHRIIQPIPRNQHLPLSFAQARLWFLHQLEQKSTAYNEFAALKITGSLRIDILERSVSEIIRRHEILRTTFPVVDGHPVQKIASPIEPDILSYRLPVINLQHLPELEQSATVQTLIREEVTLPFNLAFGPLLRTKLLQLEQTKYILLFVIHHIVTDAWSMVVLKTELATLYSAFCNDLPSPLAKLPIQYADFAYWQRQVLQKDKLTTQLNYWKQHLALAPPLLELPTDRKRPVVQTYNGSRVSFTLSIELVQKLKILNQKSETTLFMTLLAALTCLLSRYSNQSDIIIGTPIANRNKSELESLIGFFANTLALRINYEGNLTFYELLDRVRQVAIEAYANQDLPFEKLVEELQPERSLSHHPLFQVMFVLRNLPDNEHLVPNLTIAPLSIDYVPAKFDLTLSMTQIEEELVGSWEYNTDLFDAATIERMAGHFQTLLEAIVADPSHRVSDLPLLSATEQRQLLVEWNQTAVASPAIDKCIHHLFEDQVEQNPTAVAAVFDNAHITYHELNCRANQLAHHLLSLGVGPEVLVGIYLERSLEMIIAVLAILKAGGAYVPLDPSFPQQQLAFMLADSTASVLLTHFHLVNTLPQHTASVVCLDHDWESISRHKRSHPKTQVQPQALAYIIYTSGSTGQPKGVAIEHCSVVNFLSAMQQQRMCKAEDTLLSVTTLSFDIAVLELFLPLVVGAKVVVVSREVATDSEQLLQQLSDSDATIMQATPATWQMLYAAVWQGSPQLTILCGGDALSWQLAQQLRQQNAEVWNLYGPTETTIWSIIHQVDDRKGEVPIGRPIRNTQIYLLDSNLQPVPIGVVGELYIGGDGLARGYLNRPELSAQKFIPNPHNKSQLKTQNSKASRLYKTGDLARYLADGNIEFIGRIDNQIKIRGNRVELEEIEAVVCQHPEVVQAVVIAREDTRADKRLVAYIVSNQQQVPSSNELRDFLKAQLPNYMIPSAFVILDALPLTPNGKVDRRALSALELPSMTPAEGLIAPRTPTEEIVSAIWTEILGVEVGIHNNFFEMGGHSLLATRVCARLRETFCVELPLQRLFEFPTVCELSKAIEAARSSGQRLEIPAIEPVPRTGGLLASFAQARLWFLNQLEGNTATYNIPAAVQLQGSLNVAVLEQAVSEILRRHEVLRTNFEMVNGAVVQVIAAHRTITIPAVDLQPLPEEQQSDTVRGLANSEAQHPFDLVNETLIRLTLVRLAPESHVLVVVMHHIIADAWSIGIFIQELSNLYEAFSTAKVSPLPNLPIQYADFAHWQRMWLVGEVLSTQLNYWQQQLAGCSPLLELPTDRVRPPVQSFRGAQQHFGLNQSVTHQLKSLSQRCGTTLFMTLLAAFVTLLWRYTGVEDIVVGSPIANRNRRQIEALIGFFVNTLVLRINLEDNPSFVELLSQVRQVTLDAYSHQDLPFEKLVESLRLERSLSYHPLFQVMFMLQNAPMEQLQLSGLSLTPLPVETGTAKFDLLLSTYETELGLQARWEYNSDLFDATTITRMSAHFQNLLAAIVDNPTERISQLSLLTPSERQQLLVEWNNTQSDYPQYQCIHQLFEQQVERTPDAVALMFENEQLTYQQLNHRANQLAHHLRSLGVEPEVLVGIYLERSLEMIIAVLAILKAGGAYVPLDPSLPQQQLAFMLADSTASVLLTHFHLVNTLPQHTASVVCLEQDWERISRHQRCNLKTQVQPQALAYIIYTSGSTGQPKGVAIEHCSVVNFLSAMQQQRMCKAEDTLLSVTTLSFDIAVLELFLPLVVGAKVVVVSREVATDGEQLLQQLSDSDATIMQATPATWQMLYAAGWQGSPQLTILCGGDALSWQLAQQLRQQNAEVWNLYGPTETTIWSIIHQVDDRKGEVPIGRPIRNTQIYLLDSNLQPVPIGVVGELYIGGDGLARGYLNRPELSAQKFIPNPHNKSQLKTQNSKASRLYKTGDLARYLADGNIEFIGRIDNQIKIRGNRVELEEIEAVVCQHPEVVQAVVIAREDTRADKRLVAYIVSNQQQVPSSNELRDFLKAQLPNYMIPSAFVILDALPLTPNGKVDRRALSALELPSMTPAEGLIAPRTPTEEIVSAIWTEILGVEVGIHNNFFEMGGHSLLATRVCARLRETFCVELPLQRLFEFPTVCELSKAIEAARSSGQRLEIPAIEPVPRTGGLLASFAQARLWFLNQLEGNTATYNIPAAVQLQGSLNVAVLEQAVNEILRRHEVLRTNFEMVNGAVVQVIAAHRTITIPAVDLQPLPEEQQSDTVRGLANSEAQHPFDLVNETLIRLTLVRLAPESHVLVVVMHHIIADAWSIGIFIQELSNLYEAFSTAKVSPLPNLPIQYADFAHWQRMWLVGEVLSTQLNYWQQQLAGCSPLLELPTDRVRPPVQSFRGAQQHFGLNQSVTHQLKSLSQRCGTTLFMTLLAAFVTLLWRYTGVEDIVVGSPIANRNRRQIEALIGFFVNTLVLRINLEDNPSFVELLSQVRQVTLDAYSHQDLPFEKLVESLRLERSLSYHPLFQVMFMLQNAPMEQLQLSGLSLTPLPVETGTAKFDLLLSTYETELGLQARWEYNSDLFDATTITRMSAHFQNLLAAIVDNPTERISQLSLLTPSERQQLLVDWNNTECDYPQYQCIHQLFEQQVERTPDAVALMFENEQLTYQQLNHRVNQLAHHLRSLGVGPEVLVGICVERSVSMVVGVLGILKAGGAYVPLDPQLPQQRLSYMLSDSGVSVLLSQKQIVEQLPATPAIVVVLDLDSQLYSQYSHENPCSGVQALNSAYVIYTSGSTGQPKGVINTHLGVCNRLLWMQLEYQLSADERVLQKTPFSFDVSVWEFFWPLLAGACVVMAMPGGHQDRAYLVNLITHKKITTVHFVPSMLQVFLAQEGIESCSSLRRVFCSGEALPFELQQRCFERMNCKLHNLYGPTEAAIDVTYWQCQPESPRQNVPIGRPIANTQIYILDAYLQPVPIGVVGEVHIGGVAVARGYLNRPELTAQKFIPHPHNTSKLKAQNSKASRLYKTGDKARYLPDGNIEYVGRIDNQVKVRGFRIELGEIEAVLSQHPGVQKSVVIATQDIPGEKRLVAYVVPCSTVAPSNEELQRFLKQQLPDYMVPRVFVFLDTLPLTPNGKIDHRALPVPDSSRPDLVKTFVAPRTPIEQQLADIWTYVLKLEKIGIHDNFFELGGHSLLATQVISGLRDALQVELPLGTLFEAPTVAELSDRIETVQWARQQLQASETDTTSDYKKGRL
jgi:amino acid adenylation domain-containing protein